MLAPAGIFSVVAGLLMLAAPVSAGGGIDMVVACHQQYGDQWAATHGSGKYDWYCVNSTNGITAGIDLNKYCATRYGATSVAQNDGGVYDWYCT